MKKGGLSTDGATVVQFGSKLKFPIKTFMFDFLIKNSEKNLLFFH